MAQTHHHSSGLRHDRWAEPFPPRSGGRPSSQSVLAYLTKPVTKTLSESLSER